MIIRVRNICGLKGFASNPSRIILLRDENYFFRIASSYFFLAIILLSWQLFLLHHGIKLKEVPISLKCTVLVKFQPRARTDSVQLCHTRCWYWMSCQVFPHKPPRLLSLQSLNTWLLRKCFHSIDVISTQAV